MTDLHNLILVFSLFLLGGVTHSILTFKLLVIAVLLSSNAKWESFLWQHSIPDRS